MRDAHLLLLSGSKPFSGSSEFFFGHILATAVTGI
jgi:hypothetical protein